MKQILTVASTAALLSSVAADIPGDTICPAACALFSGEGDCKNVVAEGEFCKYMQKREEGIRFHRGFISPEEKLKVSEALALVQAPENNCFAMYYEKAGLRPQATYCAENNVCPKLFWDKVSTGKERDFKFVPDASSGLAPVLCDYASAEKAPLVEDVKGEVDPCKTLCAMGHKKEECNLVQRQSNVCLRLFWRDGSKSKTDFSVRVPRGTQQVVTVQEARSRMATDDCADLCSRNAACSQRGEGSHCGANKVCHRLFFVPSSDLSRTRICFEGESGCRDLDTHVHCGVKPEVVRAVKDVDGQADEVKKPNGVALFTVGVMALLVSLI